MAEWAQNIPGTKVVDGALFTQNVGFKAVAVGIDNYTPYYLYLKDADAFIAPFWVGVVRALSHTTDYGYVAVESPFGAQGVPPGQVSFIHITWTDSEAVQQTPGSQALGGGGVFTSQLIVTVPAGQRSSISLGIMGDLSTRTALYGDATLIGLEFGDGTNAPDTNLYRFTSNTLGTDDHFRVFNTSGISVVSTIHVLRNYLAFLDANPTFEIDENGALTWGAGGASAPDTNLYRSNVNTLVTDDNFQVINSSGIIVYGTGNSVLRDFFTTGDANPSFRISNVAGVISILIGPGGATAPLQVIAARRTGWGAPTGTATRTSFASDTVTLINLGRAVKALVDDLTTHGLIGA